jgi:predicted dinucleotide-binding enzyme
LLAVHWSRVDDVLKQAGDLSGKVVVTCSLPMNADNLPSVFNYLQRRGDFTIELIGQFGAVAAAVSAFSTVSGPLTIDIVTALVAADILSPGSRM